MDKLIEWKDDALRKPLLLQGVRFSGKTYLLREFGAKFFKDVFYFNFGTDKYVADLFGQETDSKVILKNLSIYLEHDITPGESLLIFDEIHLCPAALNALRYFEQSAAGYHIAAAGSYINVAIPRSASVPVGSVEVLTLYPMSFIEFLMAQSPMLANHLRESAFRGEPYKTFKRQLEEKYQDYQIVGGMPEVVSTWIETKSIEKVDTLQRQILSSIENDFAAYCPAKMLPKLSAVWNSIPAQLIKGNRKFMFTKVKKSWRGKDLDDAVYWLMRAGFVYKVEHIEEPSVPISAHVDPAFFKLYMCDAGLLRRVGGFPASMLLDRGSDSFLVRSAVAENIVCCELMRIYGRELYYWSAENPGKAEVDFIAQDFDELIPVEVKAGSAGRARSLLQYRMKFSPKMSVLTGMDNDKADVLPLYAFWNVKEWLNIRR